MGERPAKQTLAVCKVEKSAIARPLCACTRTHKSVVDCGTSSFDAPFDFMMMR